MTLVCYRECDLIGCRNRQVVDLQRDPGHPESATRPWINVAITFTREELEARAVARRERAKEEGPFVLMGPPDDDEDDRPTRLHFCSWRHAQEYAGMEASMAGDGL